MGTCPETVDCSDSWHAEENLGAADIKLTPDEINDLNEALSKIEIKGDRYPAGSEYANRTGK